MKQTFYSYTATKRWKLRFEFMSIRIQTNHFPFLPGSPKVGRDMGKLIWEIFKANYLYQTDLFK